MSHEIFAMVSRCSLCTLSVSASVCSGRECVRALRARYAARTAQPASSITMRMEPTHSAATHSERPLCPCRLRMKPQKASPSATSPSRPISVATPDTTADAHTNTRFYSNCCSNYVNKYSKRVGAHRTLRSLGAFC